MFGPGRTGDMDMHSSGDGSAPDDVTFLSSPDSMLKMPKGICFYYSLIASFFFFFLQMGNHVSVGEKRTTTTTKIRE